MTAYTKSMGEALQEMRLAENNMAKMNKAASGSMQTLKMKDGNLKMDKVTASAIMAVYNAVNPKNKKTMENMLSTGKKSDIMKLQKFALSKTKMTASYNMEEFEEELNLFEHKGESPHKHPHEDDEDEVRQQTDEGEKPGLWRNIEKKRREGRPMRKPGSKGAPTDQDFKDSQEEVDITEGRMKELHGYISDKKPADWIAKKMKLDVKTIKALMGEEIEEAVTAKNYDKKSNEETWEIIANIKNDNQAIKAVMKELGVSKKGAADMVKQTRAAYKEELELDEAADMEASGKVVAKNMMMVKSMKPYASKVAKMKTVSGIDLERMLPHDKVSVKEIDGVMSKSMNEEVELDEGTFNDVIVMKKGRVSVSVIANAANVKKKEKEGFKIDGVIEKGSSLLHKEPKRIMKAIKGGDKLNIGETVDLQAATVNTNSPMMLDLLRLYNKAMKTAPGSSKQNAYKKEIEKVRKSMGMKEEVELDEGTWHVPETRIDQMALRKTLRKPIKAKDAEKEMSKHIGDDSLYDKFADLAKENPNQDVRPAIRARMKELGIKEEVEVVDESQKGIGKVHGFQATMVAADKKKKQNEGAAADARRAIGRDKDLGKKRDSADDDMSATDDDVKAASKNIMMQLRKAQTLRGRFDVEFMDRKKQKVPAKVAQAVTAKYMALKRPAEKQKFQNMVSKSYKDMLNAIKEDNKPLKESILTRIDRKLMERKNG